MRILRKSGFVLSILLPVVPAVAQTITTAAIEADETTPTSWHA
jgi:hypothetical protein